MRSQDFIRNQPLSMEAICKVALQSRPFQIGSEGLIPARPGVRSRPFQIGGDFSADTKTA